MLKIFIPKAKSFRLYYNKIHHKLKRLGHVEIFLTYMLQYFKLIF